MNLMAIARADPLDVTVRHADLDGLFLDFYRHPPAEASHAS
jgi:hypothetical protein